MVEFRRISVGWMTSLTLPATGATRSLLAEPIRQQFVTARH